jgi:hypothetical protein
MSGITKETTLLAFLSRRSVIRAPLAVHALQFANFAKRYVSDWIMKTSHDPELLQFQSEYNNIY